MPEKNGIVLYNDNGTAPGIIMEKNGKMIVMLPGPPRETIPMFQNQVKPYLAEEAGIYLCFPYSARGRGGRECHGGKGKGYH